MSGSLLLSVQLYVAPHKCMCSLVLITGRLGVTIVSLLCFFKCLPLYGRLPTTGIWFIPVLSLNTLFDRRKIK